MKIGIRTLRSLTISLRPKHWFKNLLVFALPLSDGIIIGSKFDPGAVGRAIIVLCSLSLMSSANYIINDIKDVERDKRHSVKKLRPIASGEIQIPLAISVAVILIFLSLYSAFLVNTKTILIVLYFGVIQLIYTLFLKNLNGYDLVSLSSLYVFRAIIPAAYEEIVLSKWFLVIFFAAALFLASGKRFAELRNQVSGDTRKTLSSYSELQLALWIAISITLLITSYLNWIFTFTGTSGYTLLLFSIIPLIVILIRVSYFSLSDLGEDPTKIIFLDKNTLFLVTIWLFLYLLGKGYL
jgi:decaprenyl-phosphate phosphoribosyltransferase